MAAAQQAVDLGQVSLSKWKIGTGNYSGIAPMGDGRYAVVSDKEPADGSLCSASTRTLRPAKWQAFILRAFMVIPARRQTRRGILCAIVRE